MTAGVRLDYFHPFDNEFERDFTFDPVWEAETEVGEEGWTAEMRIPFSQLRNSGQDLMWGLNINRYVPSINEDSYLGLVPREETGWASRFADLIGLESIPSSRRIEVTPYVASSATFTSETLFDEDDPFQDGKGHGREGRRGLQDGARSQSHAGRDGESGLRTGRGGSGGGEPDGSSRRSSRSAARSSRRSGPLRGNGPSFFYSRRIGASPHGQAHGDFVDTPSTTTILGAAKLTGRLQSGLRVGALVAP